MLTPQQYEVRRNELIALLDEAVSLNMPEKYAAELKATARKCKEDQFEIALVGEFQGGKSTTFNALCDGRDISPRGLRGGGNKTSAAVISAQNISDDSTKDGLKEWAEVTFKTPSALSFGLYDCLSGVLLENKEFRELINKSDEAYVEEMMTDVGFSSIVDLTDSRQRECIVKSLHKLWERWEQNKGAVSDDELDLLRIATLQLRYFDTPEYRELTTRKVLPIVNFQKLVAFPKDWHDRWKQGEHAVFSLEECAFVFIASVLVRLHSHNLERLGCRITDCPGLFANAYDTAVAKRAISNADGVWYLLNGAIQIDVNNLKILRAIKSLQMLEKVNATFNLRGPHEQKIAQILPTTKAILKNAGLDVEVFPYNARLAFLATQGDLLLNRPNLFSDYDRACMIEDAKAKSPAADPKAMWAKMVRRAGSNTELEEVENVDVHDSESVALVRKESFLDDILGTVERSVVAKKSRSILIDKGCARAAKALVEYEGTLKAVEDAALAKEDEWKRKVEAATQQLNEFIDRAKKALERSALSSAKDSLAEQMARELIQTAIDDTFLDDITASTIVVLETVGKEFYATHASMEAAIIKQLTPIIGDLFKDSLVRAVESWKTPSQSRSLSELLRRTKAICDDLHDLWKDRHLDSDELFKGFTSPEINDDEILECCLQIANDIFVGESAIAALAESGRRGVFTLILKDILLPFILGAIGAAISLPITVAIIVGKQIWDFTRTQEQLEAAELKRLQGKVEKLSPKIRPELEKAFNLSDFRNRVAEPMAKKFLASQDEVIKKIKGALETLVDDFKETRCREPEEQFKKSMAERQAIAASNRQLRTKSIQPLRERIESFEKEVAKELAE